MPTAGEIYYYASKRGKAGMPAVVFLHGAGGNYKHWPHNLRRIPYYRIFAIDLPGHGRSAGLGEQSIAAYAGKVFTWLQEVGIYQAIFVGHSMGGAIALKLALEYEEHVLGLVLIGSGARLKVRPELIEMFSKESTFEAGVKGLVDSEFGEPAEEDVKRGITKQYLQTRPTVMHVDLVACDNFDVMDRLGWIAVPVCVICGQADMLTPIKYSEYLAANIKNASLTKVANAGHMVMLEQSEMVAGVIEEFLGSVPH